jgi:hypothetical protein
LRAPVLKRFLTEDQRHSTQIESVERAQSKCGTISRIRKSPLILLIGLILVFNVIYATSTARAADTSITFWERNVGADYTGAVAIIGGGGRTVIDLGTCLTLSSNNPVTFEYKSPLAIDSSKQYVWDFTTSDTTPAIRSQSGTIPAGMTGNVFGYYKTQYKVSFSSNSSTKGITNPSGSVWMDEGTDQIQATPAIGYAFTSWSSTGSISISNPNSNTTTVTISGPGSIVANFIDINSIDTWTIIPYVVGHGSINPPLPVNVKQGEDKTFIFTPDQGYKISNVTVDGKPVATTSSYTFDNVRADHTIRVTFGTNTLNEVQVTIDSSPNGANYVIIDGTHISTPKTYNWVIGSIHTVAASSLVAGEVGTRYSFNSWSDAGTQTHDFTVPAIQTILTANYNTQYQLTAKTNFGTTTPLDGSWFDAGAKVTIKSDAPSAADGESYVFGGWKGSFGGYTGGINPSGEFVMNGPISEETTWQHIFELKIISAYGVTTGAGWYEVGQIEKASVDRSKISSDNDSQIVFIGWGGDASGIATTSNPIIMDGPKTATTAWKTQYHLLFKQTGLEGIMLGDVNSPVLTFNGTALDFKSLPYLTKWIDVGTVVNYQYNPEVTKSMGAVYGLGSVDGAQAPLTLSGSATITGSYSFKTILLQSTAFGLIAVVVIALVLMIAYIRMRKKPSK